MTCSKPFLKRAVPCFHAICAALHWKCTLTIYRVALARTGVARVLFLNCSTFICHSQARHGVLRCYCVSGTKCFQGCTIVGTCKCLLCALLLCNVYFFAASVHDSVCESISIVVVLSLVAAQACVVTSLRASKSLNKCAKTGSALC